MELELQELFLIKEVSQFRKKATNILKSMDPFQQVRYV